MIVQTPTPSWTVYAHIAPNGKMYVGITKHTTKERWRNGKGYRHNVYFQRAIDKYGWQAFQHEIVASGLTKEEAGNMERLLITGLQLADKRLGFNQTTGGEGAIDGYTFTDDVIEKMRNSQRGKRLKSKNGNSRRVVCLDTGIEYSSAIEAAEQTGINKHHIWSNACGGRKNAGGMQWRYLDPPKRNRKMPDSYRENKRGINNGRARPLICIETGEEFDTGRDLAQHLGLSKALISTRMSRNGVIKGLHYEFIDKGEKKNGTTASES